MGVSLANDTIFARDYRIIRPLSEGGMGAVYIVEQLSTGSQRALKLMLPQFVQDPRSRQRFEQEARVGARIESEHVVQVLAAGVDDATGYPYIVMELLKGEDLAANLQRRGAVPPAEVRQIFGQLCHALAAAHAAGVVHRDLKPENIFLAASHREGASVTVKVLDFGIAKVVAEAKNSSTAAIGTPLWMAPEQTQPHSTIGPATDVWPLGLIAFRMLTGRLYWNAAADQNASTAALMREILFEDVVPASARAAQHGVGQLLPAGFDAWFGRCVSRDPAQRFANAAEARAGLEPILAEFNPGGAAVGSNGLAGLPPAEAAARTIPGSPLAPQPGMLAPQPGTAPPAPYGAPPAQQAPYGAAPPAQQNPYGAPAHTPPAQQMPYGMPPAGAAGSVNAAKPAAKKGGASTALIAVGVGVVVIGLGALGVGKMRAARARSTCEKDSTSATEANAKDVRDACRRACADKSAESCVNEGDLILAHKLADDADEAALASFTKACDLDDFRGCRRAAAVSERKDLQKAGELYTKACDHGDAPACSGLGALHELGAGVGRDRTRALALYEKACAAQDGLGCAYKSFMLGAGRGIKQDEAKAEEAAKAALPGLTASCEKGEARDCVALSVLLSAGDQKDEAKAAQLEQKACDAGEMAGCANLGVRTLLGAGVFKDTKRAIALLEQACDKGEPAACTNLGVLSAKATFSLRRGVRGVTILKLACDGVYGVGCTGWGMAVKTPADLPLAAPAAVTYSTKACDAGELTACVNLGAFHQYAVGTERNRAKASELFKKACESGDAGGCGELGTMYSTGRGVPFDGRRGMELFTQACDWGERDACAVIGDLKVNGIGVPKAPEEGAQIFKTYCEKYNLAMACNAYAGLLVQGRGVKKDPAASVALLKQTCEGKKDRFYATACVSLGNVFEAGMAGPKDLPGAAKLYQAACDQGNQGGCAGLARLYDLGLGVPRNPEKARSLAEEGCKTGDAAACDQIGYFHAMGKAGLPPNGKKGIEYFQMACDDAAWGSCTNIGLLYLFGLNGVPRDRAKAAEYLKLACSHGEEGACQKMKENAM